MPFVTTDEFSVRITKINQGLESELKEMDLLSQIRKPDHFELSFTKILALDSNFDGCEFFLEANSPGILALCETNLDDSIYSGNFPLI